MIAGSSSRISKQVILSTAFAYLLAISTAQSAPQRATDKARSKPAPSVAATPTPEVPEQVDKIAEVQVKSAVKVLQEGRTGVVYVIIRNISTVPVTITQVAATTDNDETIKTAITEFQTGQIVLPQQAHRLRVDVSAIGQIEEGAHLLLVKVDLQWNRNNMPLRGSVFASHEFSVEVLALSGLLSVLGASSILFLPGFLAVTVFFVLNRLWGKYSQGEKWQLDLKSPEFWMAALTVSLFAPYIYPLLSRWRFGEERDYRKGYGLSDVVLIWFGSILISATAWFIYRIIRETIVRYVEKKHRSLESYGESLDLEPGDEPNELLDKLTRRWEWEALPLLDKLRIIRNPARPPDSRSGERKVRPFPQGYPQHVEIRVNGSDESYFLIEPPKKDAAHVLVVPPVEYKYVELADDSSDAARASYETFRSDLDAEIKKASWDVNRIAELFKQGSSSGWLGVNWGKLASRNEKTPRLVNPRQLIFRPDARTTFFQQAMTR